MPKYEAPEMGKKTFTCPLCETLVWQSWSAIHVERGYGDNKLIKEEGSQYCKCSNCDGISWWIKGVMVSPKPAAGPLAGEGMPEDVATLYNEARAVVDVSPRSASALLRTALEVLVHNHLDQEGVKLNDAIGNLVAEGRLDREPQQAMDVLRLTGNGAVHPKEIQLDDSARTTTALFELLNLIVERLVARPALISHLYASLPETKRKAIEQRDKAPAIEATPSPAAQAAPTTR